MTQILENESSLSSVHAFLMLGSGIIVHLRHPCWRPPRCPRFGASMAGGSWWGDLLGGSGHCQGLSGTSRVDGGALLQQSAGTLLQDWRLWSLDGGTWWPTPTSFGPTGSPGEIEWWENWAGWSGAFAEFKSFGASVCCHAMGTGKSTCVCGTWRWWDTGWCRLPMLDSALRQAFASCDETSSFCFSGSPPNDSQRKDRSTCIASTWVWNEPESLPARYCCFRSWGWPITDKPREGNCIGLGFGAFTVRTLEVGSWCWFLCLGWRKCAGSASDTCPSRGASWWRGRQGEVGWGKQRLAQSSGGCLAFLGTGESGGCRMSLWSMWWWPLCSLRLAGATDSEAICTFPCQLGSKNIPNGWVAWCWSWRSCTA